MKKPLLTSKRFLAGTITALCLMAGFPSNAQNWIIYDGNVLPDATVPAWTAGDIGSPTANYSITDESGNKVLFETTSASGDKQSYKLNKGQATNATWIFRTKAGNNDCSMEFEINSKNGSAITRCYFRLMNYSKGGYLKTNYLATNVAYPSDSTLDVKSFHTYRITVQNGTNYNIYLDENPTPIVTSTGTSSTQKQFLRFGDVGTNFTEGYLDWMAYDTTAAYAPGSGTMPAGVIVDGGSTPVAPGTPVATSATTLTASGFTANWDAATVATSYYLDMATDNAFNNMVTNYNNVNVANVDSVPVTGLSSGTMYYYRVRAYNSSGTSASSNTITVTTAAALSTDATLSALSVDAGSLSPAFDPATLSYDVALPFGTTTVPTISATVNESHANAVISQAASVTGSGTVVVTAQDGTTTQTYTVNFSVAAASTDATLSALSVDAGTLSPAFDAATTTYSVTLPASTANIPMVSVTATDANANVSITQATSLTGSATVSVTAQDGTTTKAYTVSFSLSAPDAPVASDATNVAKTSFTANWAASTGATGYKLDVATDNAFSNMLTGFSDKDVANVTTFSVTGVTAATTYYYRVRAYNDGGTSANSNTISVLSLGTAVKGLTADGLKIAVSTNAVTIEAASTITEVQVTGIDGKLLVDKSIESTTATICTDGWNSGIYVFTIKTKDQVITKKIGIVK